MGIWEERPEFPEWKTPYSTDFTHYQEILEWKKREDAWLEKLKEHCNYYEDLSANFAELYADAQEKAEKWDELKNIVPKLEERLRLLENMEVVRCFVLRRRSDIEGDIEDFGELKPVLTYFLESEKVKS